MSAHRLSLRPLAVTAITLLALSLGGSTELREQAIVILPASLLILAFPPRVHLVWPPFLILGLFMAVALAAFLPANWAPLPEWRRHLEDLHVPLGSLRTP